MQDSFADPHEMAQELIKKYPAILSHIDYNKIKFEYFESEKGPIIKIEGLNNHAIAVMNAEGIEQRYKISVNSTKAFEADPVALQWMVLDALLYIGSECDGEIKPPSFKSHRPIVNAISKYGLGAYYLEHPDLPDLLGEEEVELF